MIKVTVLHESKEGKKFDLDYYLNQHIPQVRQKLGSASKRVDVDQGLGGGQPGTKPPFIVMTHLHFDSLETLQAAFAPIAAWLAEDRANYTNEPPLVQISEVKL